MRILQLVGGGLLLLGLSMLVSLGGGSGSVPLRIVAAILILAGLDFRYQRH